MDHLTERPIFDSSGMERVPFDGRTPTPVRPRAGGSHRYSGHGPGCSSSPEIGCVCGADEIEPADIAPAAGYVPASDLSPGQTAVIHGGVRVVVLSVVPYVPTDSFVPSEPWVTLNYRWAMDTQGETMAGRWSLPASQCLRMA